MDGGSIKRIVEATGLELSGNPSALFDALQTADVEHSMRPAVEKVGKKRLSLNPADWLLGQRLPEIYSQFFEKDPGRSRNKDGSLRDGPCIRFIRASLRELQITKRDGTPYAAETIAKAISESRKPRPRRGATRRK